MGIRVDGCKEILGLWIQDNESKHTWMQIFGELKNRGVQEVGFISMDGVSELEEGAKAIFPEVVVQRCIVHLIRDSLKYVNACVIVYLLMFMLSYYGVVAFR